jgi:alpha-D-ribose 1-methylphosphonate 5-triphosphate synthase subunit PhnL
VNYDLFMRVVPRIPMCSFCIEPAVADGLLKEGRQKAYMCHWHFQRLGLGLGTGLGQILLHEDSTK